MIELAKSSMQAAIEEVKGLPHYSSSGEVKTYICIFYNLAIYFNMIITVGHNGCSA